MLPASNIVNEEIFTPADVRLRELNANELVFAVVGPIGSGTSEIANNLKALLSNDNYDMETHIIKASDAIKAWCNLKKRPIEKSDDKLKSVTALQDAGDDMREADPAAVGVELISQIKILRQQLSLGVENVASIVPARTKAIRVYILDSLKNPAEVEILRSVYKNAFCLIGVVCEQKTRELRLQDHKYSDASKNSIKALMNRDADAEIKYGQKVVDTFHLADYFVDNSPSRYLDAERHQSNPKWTVPEQLARLIDLIACKKVLRPTASETGMFYADGAKMRSACLSRQVGAALLDSAGSVISTGTNEVPKAGGGLYGGSFDDELGESENNHRCAVVNGYCSSNRSQTDIIKKIIEQIPALNAVEDKDSLMKQLKKTPIGRLLEFSRAVHAEMDALLSAARKGKSTVGSRLFVTTFPCHYCARHVVSAGVEEVQYIEPYPKSKALSLHGDAITQSSELWVSSASNKNRIDGMEMKVLFRPFTGVAPRLYKKVFLKNRPLKDADGNMTIGKADYASGLFKLSYQEIENSILSARGDISV